MLRIFNYITHNNGILTDSALELLAGAKKIDSDVSVTAIVIGSGSQLDLICDEVSSFYKEVWKIDNPVLSYPNAEIIRQVLLGILPKNSIFLAPHCTFGMDLSPGLSIKLGFSFISDVVDINMITASKLSVVRQEFGGMVSTNVECDVTDGAVLNLRPGSFQLDSSFSKVSGIVIDKSNEVTLIDSDRNFIEIVKSKSGDVDITKSDILISVGRGIEEEENIEIAQELADVLGNNTAVSCSRPIVDANWMDKSRQVGTSGMTVKPKVYIACGISGSFQHLGGLKGAPFVIAINKNKRAPIFQVADVGVEADILEFIPELTEAVKNM